QVMVGAGLGCNEAVSLECHRLGHLKERRVVGNQGHAPIAATRMQWLGLVVSTSQGALAVEDYSKKHLGDPVLLSLRVAVQKTTGCHCGKQGRRDLVDGCNATELSDPLPDPLVELDEESKSP